MFNAKQDRGTTRIFFEGEEILTFVQEHLWFRGLRISNLKLRPGGPVEIIECLHSCFYLFSYLRAHISFEIPNDHTIKVHVSPEKVDNGLAEKVHEELDLEINYDPSKQRFEFNFEITAKFLKDIRRDEEHGLYIDGMELQNNEDLIVVTVDDPLLSGGKGPQVPMTQDWVGLPEPVFHEAGHTSDWQRRFHGVLLNTRERGHKRVPFNRTLNSVSQFYNRHVLELVAGDALYYEKIDGKYLEYQPLSDYRCGHHICEWGYDMHWYALEEPASDELLFREGQELHYRFRLRECDADEVPAAFREAPEAEMEKDELELADLPMYEEPFCSFSKPAYELPDACRWTKQGEGCDWIKQGSFENHGALVFDHETAKESIWLFNRLGPTNGCNPIPPRSIHTCSAWIRSDELDQLEIEVAFRSYHGPGMYHEGHSTTGAKFRASECVRETRDGYQLITFETEPSGGYILDGSIAFTYKGKGRAEIAKLAIERL